MFAHVNLTHFFSSSWCQGLAATSTCGSTWTFLITFFMVANNEISYHKTVDLPTQTTILKKDPLSLITFSDKYLETLY